MDLITLALAKAYADKLLGGIDDAIELVAELELVSPIVSSDGYIYTDENGFIYTL